ncbi:hypothetical protein [Stakelama marina]|uniref:Uncharacterized protein n=1 Tax=Stakelama marina TaxID=2826939 RepID=A0A8T4IGQ5_9SPHN|nr:hypothetical protein [Stakelama marina]MBR0553803.1 hypothetical protein [Stakelama marina]
MEQPTPQKPLAGGILLTIGIFAGVVIGLIVGQVTIGFFAGLGAGMVALILLELWQRGRR